MSKGVKSVRSRVTNIKEHLKEDITVEDFKKLLLKRMFGEENSVNVYELNDADYENINKLVEEKYGTWEWVFGTSPSFNVEKERRFTGGKVEVKLNVEDGIIKDIKFYGDFFGHGELKDVEEKIIGIKYKSDEIESKLSNIDLEYYFAGISKEELLDLIIN